VVGNVVDIITARVVVQLCGGGGLTVIVLCVGGFWGRGHYYYK